ncbi:MAG TPA: glycoside hydrolase domain-containing protein, partial [Candidatus Acidoferrales bacterium]|nr:glycoside hydrolase domain-containing protein [Candidatus Acidoferrales bacterium]
TQLWGDTPDGLPGNDDLGTMSAWYVWCAIGLYPQNPATGVLDLGAPLFSHVDIRIPGAAGITIDAPAASTNDAFVQNVRVNGQVWPRSWIVYSQTTPTRLFFALRSVPNPDWAAAPADAPPSYAPHPVSFVPSTQAAISVDPSELALSPGGVATLGFALANPAGAAATQVTWRALVPGGLQLAPANGTATLSSGQNDPVTTQLAAAQTTPTGLYDVAIAGTTANAALVERATRVVRVARPGERLSLAYATNFFDNSIQAIDARTMAFGAPIAVGEFPRDLTVDPSGSRAYVADEQANELSIVDLRSGTTIATVRVGSTPWGIRMTPDGSTVWVANNGDDTVQPIDVATLAAGTPVKVGLAPGDLAVTPDGKTLYVADQNSDDVTPVDVRRRVALTPIPVGARPRGLAVTPDGKTLFVSDMGSNTITPIDVASGQAAAPIPTGVAPRGLAVSPDGRYLLVANFGTNDATLIDVASRSVIATIPVGLNPTAVSFLDATRALVAQSGDNDCVVVDVVAKTVSAGIPLGTRPTAIAR